MAAFLILGAFGVNGIMGFVIQGKGVSADTKYFLTYLKSTALLKQFVVEGTFIYFLLSY